MEPIIRPIDLQDRNGMLDLLSLQMAAYLKEAEMIGLPDVPPLLDSPDSLRESGERFAGCYEDGELIGAVSTLDRQDCCSICRLMVHPDRLRQGTASRLLRYVLHEASARRVSVKVRTVTANLAAMSLYGRFGFQPLREHPLENGLVIVELLLDKSAVCTDAE